MEDRRKSARSPTSDVAYIFADGASTRCHMVDVSEAGAAIDVPNASNIPRNFQLMTANDRVVRNCRLVWEIKNRIGVAYVNATDK